MVQRESKKRPFHPEIRARFLRASADDEEEEDVNDDEDVDDEAMPLLDDGAEEEEVERLELPTLPSMMLCRASVMQN